MPRYKPYDYKQSKLVVVDYEAQLQPGTFEHALHHLIDKRLDLSIFDVHFKNEDTGRLAYDPAILLKIILFAYSKGITSSREIQWCCRHNILFQALSCDTVPHWTTIAHFVSSHPDEIEELFEQILLVCDEQGLLGKELFAIDGCKLPSNAAKEWSGTFKELTDKQKKIQQRIRVLIGEHRRIDEEEETTGDAARTERTERTLETLNRANKKIERFLKTARPRMGRGKRAREVKSNITDNDSAKMTTSKGTIQGYTGLAAVDRKHQIIVEAQAFGDGQEHHTLEPMTRSVRTRFERLGISPDIYDEGTQVTADAGFASETNMRYLHDEGIDGYVPDTRFRERDERFAGHKARHRKPRSSKVGKWFPAHAFEFDPQSRTCRCPAGNDLALRREEVDKRGNRKLFFEGYLLQCRHCALKHQCLRNPNSADHRNGHGRQVSFILEKDVGPGNYYMNWMRRRIDSEQGREIYGHRMSVVEPVFANITANKKLKRFSLRSRPKVQGQWRLFCLVHNIEKIMNYGMVPA